MKVNRIVIVICTLMCLMIVVHSHSGRTDANGGHWDRSTGTYHFHSGEYAGRGSSSSSSKEYEYEPFTPPYDPPKENTYRNNSTKDEIKWYHIILMSLNILWIAPLAHEFISSSIKDKKRKKQHKVLAKQQNAEYDKTHTKRKRRQCVNCSYCRWKYYHPFPNKASKYYWSFVTKQPLYCRKFKTKLSGDSMLTCISELNSNAMYEKESEEQNL